MVDSSNRLSTSSVRTGLSAEWTERDGTQLQHGSRAHHPHAQHLGLGTVQRRVRSIHLIDAEGADLVPFLGRG